MATKTIDQELLEVEGKYWQAVKDRNVTAAMMLTDDPCIIAGASGIASVDRAAFQKIMSGATYTLNSFHIDPEVKVRLIQDDIAIMAYKVKEDLTVDGKPVS